MRDHELPLAAFLAGELGADAARRVDEHLLSCDRCWSAVSEDRTGRTAAGSLREPVAAQFADQIRLAVELAPAQATVPGPTAGRHHPSRRAAAATGTVTVGLLAVIAIIWPSRTPHAADSSALREVVALAGQLPAGGVPQAITPLGPSRTLDAGGQPITVRSYSVQGGAALVAISPSAFAMPADARMPAGRAMPWTITRGPITIYCPHADVLLAGPEPASELAALAVSLRLS